jgi:hypothetical protein
MKTKESICELVSALKEGRVTLNEIKRLRLALDKGVEHRFVVLKRRNKIPVAYYGPMDALDGEGVEEREDVERMDAEAMVKKERES